jgi:hypothetical protein
MLIHRLIDADEIANLCAVVSTPAGLREALRGTASAQKLLEALDLGLVSTENLRDFAQNLTKDFTPGVRFSDEPELCLLAVVLENHESSFSDTFLTDLAAVNVAELPLAPRVARLCLQSRVSA